ncbi:DUF697 domain-containing protein [Telmatospirillum sp.]|uniref:YcjF family protein n=1 Tax=Telmatospirillum sp. TaxID=2079197 RepID=UPI00283FA260|nr:DUF697 domain-containing protein [Telmatospirillum sp.]MDR3436277.1 DUF697 domain-containing protein [Telmatospirillum sp.]
MTNETKSKSQESATEKPVIDAVGPAVETAKPAAETVSPAVEAAAPATESAAPVAETVDPEVARHNLSVTADKIIRHNVYWAIGAGVIPISFVDTAALIVVQLKLLKELGDAYGVPFKANAGKSAVTALLTGVGTSMLSGGILGSGAAISLLRHTPVLGTVVSLATQPAFSAAFTYAVGAVFKHHFETGGTFLTFDAKAVKARFSDEFSKAKDQGVAATAAA